MNQLKFVQITSDETGMYGLTEAGIVYVRSSSIRCDHSTHDISLSSAYCAKTYGWKSLEMNDLSIIPNIP